MNYSKPFNCKLTEIPYINMVEEIINTNFPLEKTKYFNYVSDLLEKHGEVWGWIKTKEDCLKRAKMFRDIAISIQLHGIKEFPTWTNGELTDGHHRMSVFIYLTQLKPKK